MTDTAFYRFPISDFVEGETFEDAKAKLIERIESVKPEHVKKVACTCLGFTHRMNCKYYVVPY